MVALGVLRAFVALGPWVLRGIWGLCAPYFEALGAPRALGLWGPWEL